MVQEDVEEDVDDEVSSDDDDVPDLDEAGAWRTLRRCKRWCWTAPAGCHGGSNAGAAAAAWHMHTVNSC